MALAKKIKQVLLERDMEVKDLAERMSINGKNMSSNNLHNKLRRDNFNESELQDIAKALDSDLIINFKLRDTGKVF